MSETLILSTAEVLKKFHPENPREHSEENDLPWIRDSLLDFGWLIYPTIQQNLDGSFGHLLSGHGRVQGAEWLGEQDDDFFLKEWERWLKGDGREKVAARHQGRFCSDYWHKIPLVPVTLDELSQKSALLRLNNTSHDGRDDPGKIAAILAQMPKRQIKTAGWDSSTANSFMNAFLIRKSEEPDEDIDPPEAPKLANKQDYEAGNATVNVLAQEVNENAIPTPAESVIVGTEEIGEVGSVSTINYAPPEDQQQFMIFISKESLPSFRESVVLAAGILGIPQEGLLQQWRSLTIVQCVNEIVKQSAGF